jgi:putative tricarboxylic transport membrane protein
VARADRVIGLLLLALAAGYYWLSGDIETGLASDRLGPRFVPRALAVLLAATSALLVLRTLVGRRAGRAAAGAPAAGAPEDEKLGRLWATLALTAAYLVAMPRVGFLLLTPAYLAAFTLLFGYRRVVPLLGTAVGTTVVLHLVFARALGVRLPTGLLGE